MSYFFEITEFDVQWRNYLKNGERRGVKIQLNEIIWVRAGVNQVRGLFCLSWFKWCNFLKNPRIYCETTINRNVCRRNNFFCKDSAILGLVVIKVHTYLNKTTAFNCWFV